MPSPLVGVAAPPRPAPAVEAARCRHHWSASQAPPRPAPAVEAARCRHRRVGGRDARACRVRRRSRSRGRRCRDPPRPRRAPWLRPGRSATGSAPGDGGAPSGRDAGAPPRASRSARCRHIARRPELGRPPPRRRPRVRAGDRRAPRSLWRRHPTDALGDDGFAGAGFVGAGVVGAGVGRRRSSSAAGWSAGGLRRRRGGRRRRWVVTVVPAQSGECECRHPSPDPCPRSVPTVPRRVSAVRVPVGPATVPVLAAASASAVVGRVPAGLVDRARTSRRRRGPRPAPRRAARQVQARSSPRREAGSAGVRTLASRHPPERPGAQPVRPFDTAAMRLERSVSSGAASWPAEPHERMSE